MRALMGLCSARAIHGERWSPKISVRGWYVELRADNERRQSGGGGRGTFAEGVWPSMCDGAAPREMVLVWAVEGEVELRASR
jgi:hypothetical protein